MPSISRAPRPASAIAFRIASHAIESVVRFEGRICGVSPTPTIQYLSVSAPMILLSDRLPTRPSCHQGPSRKRTPRNSDDWLVDTLLQLEHVAVGIAHPDLLADHLHLLGRELKP